MLWPHRVAPQSCSSLPPVMKPGLKRRIVPVSSISMRVPFVSFSTNLKKLASKSVPARQPQPALWRRWRADSPRRPGCSSSTRIASMRSGLPLNTEHTTRWRKCVQPRSLTSPLIARGAAGVLERQCARPPNVLLRACFATCERPPIAAFFASVHFRHAAAVPVCVGRCCALH